MKKHRRVEGHNLTQIWCQAPDVTGSELTDVIHLHTYATQSALSTAECTEMNFFAPVLSLVNVNETYRGETEAQCLDYGCYTSCENIKNVRHKFLKDQEEEGWGKKAIDCAEN